MADPVTYCTDRGWACEPVLDATGNRGLANALGWLSEKPLTILAIIVVAWFLNRVLRRLIKKLGERMMTDADRVGEFVPSRFRRADDGGRSTARGEAVSTIARSIATTVVIIVALTAILSELGVSLAALFASAGVAGVALGFGAQNLVRDVLAGWFIVVEDRYGVGDTIDAGSPAVGVVERVTLRSTRVRDINGTVWHVANGEIVRVGNKSQNWSRAVVDVVISPAADVDQACGILESVGRSIHDDPEWAPRLKGRAEVLGVHLMDPTGITLRVIQSTAPAGQFPVEREFRRQVIRAFEENGIPLAAVPPVAPRGATT
ncbi:MAG: mechanosensitive ion channel family protein [Microthrixaceae bacterium]